MTTPTDMPNFRTDSIREIEIWARNADPQDLRLAMKADYFDKRIAEEKEKLGWGTVILRHVIAKTDGVDAFAVTDGLMEAVQALRDSNDRLEVDEPDSPAGAAIIKKVDDAQQALIEYIAANDLSRFPVGLIEDDGSGDRVINHLQEGGQKCNREFAGELLAELKLSTQDLKQFDYFTEGRNIIPLLRKLAELGKD